MQQKKKKKKKKKSDKSKFSNLIVCLYVCMHLLVLHVCMDFAMNPFMGNV